MNETPSKNTDSTPETDEVPRRNPILVLTVIAAVIAIIALTVAMLFQSPDYFGRAETPETMEPLALR